MKSRLLAPLIIITLMLSGVAVAFAPTWVSPTYPFYGGGGGAIYFNSGFTATNGSWIGQFIAFTGFNYAGAGAFGATVGFDADIDTTMTLLEAVPLDHILLNTNSVGATRNVTLWLQGCNVVNVTNAASWHWSNVTYILKITTPIGLTNINISFIAGGGGGTPTTFYIPQWFLNQGGAFFGIADLFTNLMSVMGAFVVWFTTSVSNVVALIFSIASIVFFVGGSVIYWFGLFVTFWMGLFGAIGNILNGTSSITTGLGDMWSYFGVATWIGFIPLVVTVAWFDSVPKRAKRSGQGEIQIIIADIQIIMYVVGTVWEWSFTIFTFVFNTVMTFVSLVWSLIP